MRLESVFCFVMLLSSSAATAPRRFDGEFVLNASTQKFSALGGKKSALLYVIDGSNIDWKKVAEADDLRREFVYRECDIVIQAYLLNVNNAEAARLFKQHNVFVPVLGDENGVYKQMFGSKRFQAVVVDKQNLVRYTGPFVRDDVRDQANKTLESPNLFCPVDKMWITIEPETPSAVYKGRRYYFCHHTEAEGQRMKAAFIKDPEVYLRESAIYRNAFVDKVRADEMR